MRRSILTCILVILLANPGLAQNNFNHNVVWGRLALTDTITTRLRWELFIQHRRQNDPDNELDAFKAPQFTSYWAWLYYSLSPTTRISVSPFGYFKSWILIAQPADLDKESENYDGLSGSIRSKNYPGLISQIGTVWSIAGEILPITTFFCQTGESATCYAWKSPFGLYG